MNNKLFWFLLGWISPTIIIFIAFVIQGDFHRVWMYCIHNLFSSFFILFDTIKYRIHKLYWK